MSSSQISRQVDLQAARKKGELEAQAWYRQMQIDILMEEKRRERNLDSKVHIPKFDGQLDPDLFLEWLWTVESVFAYEDIPEANKVKLVALRFRKYASIWWTNLVAKRVRQGKDKIRTWAKMKSKLKARFLPPTYVQNPYSQLPHSTQAFPTFEEVREFVQPPPKGQPFNKGSPSYPSKPITPSNFFPQESPTPQNSPLLQHNEQTVFKEEEENREVCVMEEEEEDVEEGELLIVEEVDDHGKDACEPFIILDSPQNLELEQVGPSLPSNGTCHDNQEADWNLPPTSDEQELQVFKLQPCDVVEELEPPSPQKECPNSPQELRTILFKERGNDVYSLGAHDVYSLWFEFHDKRHVMEFYLARTKLKQANSALGTSPGTKSAFVYFLVQDLLDQINFFSFYL